jgi:uncharacterized protein (TIGR02466 family)
MQYYPMFAQSVICDQIEDEVDNQQLIKFAYNLAYNSPSRSFSNKGGFQSCFIDFEPEVQQLINQIEQTFSTIKEIYGLNDETRLSVDSMWVNVNPPFSYNSNHIHPGMFLSGSYYLKVPENSGSIYFINPSQLQPLFTRQDLIKQYNPQNSLRWSVPNTVGQLFIFPSWIEHGVSQNLSKEDRISIAFNIRIEQ